MNTSAFARCCGNTSCLPVCYAGHTRIYTKGADSVLLPKVRRNSSSFAFSPIIIIIIVKPCSRVFSGFVANVELIFPLSCSVRAFGTGDGGSTHTLLYRYAWTAPRRPPCSRSRGPTSALSPGRSCAWGCLVDWRSRKVRHWPCCGGRWKSARALMCMASLLSLALQGLRTLVICMRELDNTAFERWRAEWEAAERDIDNRNARVRNATKLLGGGGEGGGEGHCL